MKRKNRYRYFWYGMVLTMIKRYPWIKTGTSEKTKGMVRSIEKAIEDTKVLPDGELRIRAIQMIYFDGTHTIDGAAMEIGACRRTIQKWCSEFVVLVGKYDGYMDEENNAQNA